MKGEHNVDTEWETGVTVAAVAQVGPDDVLLREAEDSQSTSSHCGVYDDAGVRHHLRALIETNPAHQQRAGDVITQ